METSPASPVFSTGGLQLPSTPPSDALPSLPTSPTTRVSLLSVSSERTPISSPARQESVPHSAVIQGGLFWADIAKQRQQTQQHTPHQHCSQETHPCMFNLAAFPVLDDQAKPCLYRRSSNRQVSWSDLIQDVSRPSLPLQTRELWWKTVDNVVDHEKCSLQSIIDYLKAENDAISVIVEHDDPKALINAVADLAQVNLAMRSQTTSTRLSVESFSRLTEMAKNVQYSNAQAISLQYQVQNAKAMVYSASPSSVPDCTMGIHDRILASVRDPEILSSRENCIVRFPVTKINRFHRNSPRILELDIENKSIVLCKSSCSTDGRTAGSRSMSATQYSLLSRSTPESPATCDELLLSVESILDVEMYSELEFHVHYLVSSAKLRKQKTFRALFPTAASRERCCRLIHLHILSPTQKNMTKKFSPQVLTQQRPRHASLATPIKSSDMPSNMATSTLRHSFSQLSSTPQPCVPVSLSTEQHHGWSIPEVACSYTESRTPPVIPSSLPIDVLAQLAHRAWTCERMANGWTYECRANAVHRTHPDLVAFDELSERVQEQKRNLVRGTCDAILALGFVIKEPRFGNPLMCLDELSEELPRLVEMLAENVHDMWARALIADDWTYGSVLNFALKQHPNLVAFGQLGERERAFDRQIVSHVLGALLEMGYLIEVQSTQEQELLPMRQHTFHACSPVR